MEWEDFQLQEYSKDVLVGVSFIPHHYFHNSTSYLHGGGHSSLRGNKILSISSKLEDLEGVIPKD
jgi:hypothetical protein